MSEGDLNYIFGNVVYFLKNTLVYLDIFLESLSKIIFSYVIIHAHIFLL